MGTTLGPVDGWNFKDRGNESRTSPVKRCLSFCWFCLAGWPEGISRVWLVLFPPCSPLSLNLTMIRTLACRPHYIQICIAVEFYCFYNLVKRQTQTYLISFKFYVTNDIQKRRGKSNTQDSLI